MITASQVRLIFISHPYCHSENNPLCNVHQLTIYHWLSTVSREIRSQENVLQWHLDINIHVWVKQSTFQLTGSECSKWPQSTPHLRDILYLFSSSVMYAYWMLTVCLLAFICVWVEGMLMRILGIPPLAGNTRCCFVDFPTVILPSAAETVGGEAGALPFLHPNLSWAQGARGRGNKSVYL